MAPINPCQQNKPLPFSAGKYQIQTLFFFTLCLIIDYWVALVSKLT